MDVNQNQLRPGLDVPIIGDDLAQRLTGKAAAGDERKLRSTIRSIFSDQEELRMTSKIISTKTAVVAGSGAALAVLATLSVSSAAWAVGVLPLLTSALFGYASIAESSGMRSKGIAKYSAGQAVRAAAMLENILAEAENRKAWLPFGVGLTAVCATGCVILRAFNREYDAEVDPMYATASLGLFFVFALASVVGSCLSTDKWFRMSTTLGAKPPEDVLDDEGAFDPVRPMGFDSAFAEPAFQRRVAAALLTLAACILPVPFVIGSSQFSEWQNELDDVFVIISAAAATSSAAVCLAAEREFADKEQVIAVQCKQACLSELFAAQAVSEAARLPVRTAAVGSLLAVATLAIEFSLGAAAFFPWPALLGALPSVFGSSLIRSEADASWTEWKQAIKGTNVVESTVLELQRIASDLLKLDKAAEDIRDRLKDLPSGESCLFPGLPAEGRRQVHFVAAELGYPSRSVGDAEGRTVLVTNRGVGNESRPEEINAFSEVAATLKAEAIDFIKMGVSVPLLLPAAVIAATSLATPVVAGPAVTALVVPLLAGGVGLVTIWQERTGKMSVAASKSCTAELLVRVASSEARIGRATTNMAPMPMYIATCTFATVASALPLVVRPCPVLLRLVGLPMVLVSGCVIIAALERQRRAQRQLEAAMDTVEGPAPRSGIVSMRNWWVPPLLLGALAPGSLPQRLSLVCTALAIEVVLLHSCALRQLYTAEVYHCRCARVHARADAWAQEASTASRALPFGSAAAIINILFSTAFASFSPFVSVFPIVALGVCGRAIQWTQEARRDVKRAQLENQSLQKSVSSQPPPWFITERPGDPKSTIGLFVLSDDPNIVDFGMVLPEGARSTRRRSPWRRAFTQGWSGLRWALGRLWVKSLRALQESSPESQYAPGAAERSVRSIQSNLDELTVSVRTSERNWKSAGSVVATGTLFALLSPMLLSDTITEIVLPLVGSGLTLFAVSAESKARRRVAASKVACAQIGHVCFTIGEFVAAASLCKADLIMAAGLSAHVCMLALVLEGPMHASFVGMQAFLRIALVLGQALACAWSVRKFLGCMRLGEKVLETVNQPVQEVTLVPTIPLDVEELNTSGVLCRSWRLACLLAVAPTLLLAFWPLSRPFSQRAVAATAAGAAVVSLVLLAAERTCSTIERVQASRHRSFALADTFSNEAEQTAALLPFTSAATIALSAAIALVSEVNPFSASALTVVQAVIWIVSSRRALATKFESLAALQVDSVAAQPTTWDSSNESMGRRLKHWAIN